MSSDRQPKYRQEIQQVSAPLSLLTVNRCLPLSGPGSGLVLVVFLVQSLSGWTSSPWRGLHQSRSSFGAHQQLMAAWHLAGQLLSKFAAVLFGSVWSSFP